MPLSEREQRILEQLERELASEDPKLATTMTEGPKASFGRVMIAILGIAAGLLLLLIGVSNHLTIVGIAGFAVMVIAVIAASMPSRKTKLHVVDATGVPAKSRGMKGAGAPRKTGTFTQRMEERWEKRQRGE